MRPTDLVCLVEVDLVDIDFLLLGWKLVSVFITDDRVRSDFSRATLSEVQGSSFLICHSPLGGTLDRWSGDMVRHRRRTAVPAVLRKTFSGAEHWHARCRAAPAVPLLSCVCSCVMTAGFRGSCSVAAVPSIA